MGTRRRRPCAGSIRAKSPMPEINPAKVCFVIEKARELLSEDVGIRPTRPTPPTTASDHSDRRQTSRIRHELVEFIRDLDVDESAALVALAWIGRGDFEADDWKSAVAAANERREGPTWKYLLGMPLLPDYLAGRALGFRPVLRGLRTRRRIRIGRRSPRRRCSAAARLAFATGSRHFCAATTASAPCRSNRRAPRFIARCGNA